ncbi:MAG: helix-turn-helix domain-containing protein [Gammaproteobacteria bacterium]|nr:helix-turn-helix domain-containing protein [Gammaproteobacteria bacterium]
MASSYPKLASILRKLLFNKNINAAELARSVEIPAPTIHRILVGKCSRPHMTSLRPIADYFSISVDQLIGETPILDQSMSVISMESKIRAIPIYGWDELKVMSDFNINPVGTVPFFGESGAKIFGTILPDTSMEPMFIKNSILIFDPEKTINDRSYVLVKIKGYQLAFRQILLDAEDKYLKALNSDLKELQMRLLTDEDQIIGILLESRINFEGR